MGLPAAWRSLQRQEVFRIIKPEHFVQAQIYMRKMGIASCLYFAVCKNTDDLYIEIITLDPMDILGQYI